MIILFFGSASFTVKRFPAAVDSRWFSFEWQAIFSHGKNRRARVRIFSKSSDNNGG